MVKAISSDAIERLSGLCNSSSGAQGSMDKNARAPPLLRERTCNRVAKGDVLYAAAGPFRCRALPE